MRYYKYMPYMPNNPKEKLVSETDILELYWDWWSAKMDIAVRTKKNTSAFGRPELITKENCIRDWVTVQWAYEVEVVNKQWVRREYRE